MRINVIFLGSIGKLVIPMKLDFIRHIANNSHCQYHMDIFERRAHRLNCGAFMANRFIKAYSVAIYNSKLNSMESKWYR